MNLYNSDKHSIGSKLKGGGGLCEVDAFDISLMNITIKNR